MKVRVLGSSAGGGLPQWNCGCPHCVRARSGDKDVPPRSQPSLAVSGDGRRWSLLNASPDVRDQLARFPALHPRPGTRDLPLDSIVLTNADLDHVLGLLVLRESLPYRILSTRWVRDALLLHNAVFRLLEPAWGTLELDEPVALDREGRIEARLFPVSGKPPTHLRDAMPSSPQATVGVRLTDTGSGRRLVYVPGARSLEGGTAAELEAAMASFVDGTFFTEDELASARPGAPDALAMGHVPVSGAKGSLARLAALPGRRLYTHVNNTNPLVDAGSKERRWAEAAGVEVACDGLEFDV
ncbi:MAG TPA: pyrroloquinoline quinone biosynthesis protein PqqB [Myxococcota bacterium]|jgi:pyrroloquinoline quinone biosynthesis protein B|nr:pyrroloquinoline quinone biosynthesis protein PqqB [Myxococcota bacterium]